MTAHSVQLTGLTAGHDATTTASARPTPSGNATTAPAAADAPATFRVPVRRVAAPTAVIETGTLRAGTAARR